MTGIERLRELTWNVSDIGGRTYRGGFVVTTVEDIYAIADQIERERACDADTTENVRLIVGGVIDSMECHVSGVEGAEDSPVARWARELRDALKSDTSEANDAQNPSCADPAKAADVSSEAQKVTRDPAADVSKSAYDLLPQKEREIIAWVRKHGGLDYVKSEWRSRVPYDRYERRRQRLLGHIAECEAALGRRNERIADMGLRIQSIEIENAKLRKRAMPDGCEWPRYTSGEPVEVGDDVAGPDYGERIHVDAVKFHANGFTLYDKNGFDKWYESDERFERPVVLASDGEPLEVGQTVWDTNGDELIVGALEDGGHTVTCRYVDVGDGIPVHGMWSPSDLTHQRPVLDADGAPIREGDTVWDVETGIEFEVSKVSGCAVTMSNGAYYSSAFPRYCPSKITHAKPEPRDSWERIEEDADALVDAEINGEGSYNAANAYCNRRGLGEGTTFVLMAQDLVRRAKALAGRDE